MRKYFIMQDTLSAIATAIRSKSGKTDLIQVEKYAEEINALTGGIVYIEPVPYSFTLYADQWDGTSYELAMPGYKTVYNCLIDIPGDSGIINTETIIASGLTAPRTYTLDNTPYVTISAVNVPTQDINIAVYGLTPYNISSYEVVAVDGASYGFNYVDSYYISQNKGVHNSAAVCKLQLNMSGIDNLFIDCINYGESTCDFGILSNLDTTLTTNNTIDSSGVFKSFSGQQSSNVVSIDYGIPTAGEHFIYIKYRKDGSVHSNNDTLMFQVRFEAPEDE